MPSLEPSESERSWAQSLTPLSSSPRCTPCLKNAPLWSCCFKVLPEVPRATALGPCAGHALSTHGRLESYSPHLGGACSGDVLCLYMGSIYGGPPRTFPVKPALRLDVCKAPGAEAGFSPRGQGMEGVAELLYVLSVVGLLDHMFVKTHKTIH